MRKFLSMILAIVMIISVLPVSALATDEVATTTGVSAETDEIPENYGTEVTVGNNIYYIEDGDLLYSSNNGRARTIDNAVTWVIEEAGNVYYSKLDGNNTYIYKVGDDEEIAKLFCPVDCFDVYEDDVYYSYNGEVVKLNTAEDKEEVVYTDKNIKIFCYNGVLILDDYNNITNEQHEGKEEIQTSAVTDSMQIRWVGNTQDDGYATFYTKNQKSYSIPAYTLNQTRKWMVPCEVITISNGSNGNLTLRVKVYVSKQTGEIWYYVPCSGETAIAWDAIMYNDRQSFGGVGKFIRKSDLDKAFSTKKSSNVSYYTLGYLNSMGGGSVTITPFICYSHSYASIKTATGIVLDVGICRKCEHKYNLDSTWTSVGGKYVRKPGSTVQTTMRVEPYEDASPVNGGSGDISEYYITGYITNAYGSKWYRVTERKILANKQLKGWVHHAKIDEHFYPPQSFVVHNVPMNNGNFGEPSSNIVISPGRYPTGTITRGKFNLTGSISSSNNLVSTTAQVINANTGAVELSASNYVGGKGNYLHIESSNLNYGLKFANLTTGTYYLLYTATDTGNGEPKPWRSPDFNVFDPYAPNCPQPSVANSAIEYGQRVSASCSEPGALIHMTVNGREITGYNTVATDITTAGSHIVTAWTTNGGVTSGSVTKTVSVLQKSSPVISDAKYTDSYARVTISGDGEIYYTTNGTTPTKNSKKYTGPIDLENSKTITAISTGYGYVNSAVSSKSIIVKEPEAPQITLNTEEKIAQGKSATVSWNKADRAFEYTAYLIKDGDVVKKLTTEDTSATFVLDEKNDDENLEYEIKVVASNLKGESDESNSVKVMAMHPVVVTFIDRILREGNITDEVVEQIQTNVDEHYRKSDENYDENQNRVEGNVISVQKIDYNSKPGIPAWDDKVGFSRQHFSDEAYQKITEDTTAYAYYSVKSYTVQFWNYWRDYSGKNKQIGPTQNILYSFSAEAPVEFEVPEGCVLAGWSVDSKLSDCYDFTFVEGDMRLDTVYTWENEDLPVILEISDAKRGNTCETYEVDLRYIHYYTENTKARLIVTLYTADNKVVDVATKDVYLMPRDPGIDDTDSMTIEYPDQVSRISAVMVQIVDDKTGGAVSEMVSTTDIEMPTADTYWTKWSDWSTTKPGDAPDYNEDGFQGIKREIDTKTQYRYRNRDYQSSPYSYLAGWELYNTRRTGWGPTQGPVYSNPGNGARNVWSEPYVTSSNYKDVYRYYRISSSEHALYGSGGWEYAYRYNYEYDTPLNKKPGTSYSFYKPCGCYTLSSIGDWFHTVYSVNYLGEDYPEKRKVSDNYGTRWYYQDPVYTYDHRRWLDWSSWSDSPVSGDEVQTREVYSYRDEFNLYQGYDPTKDSKNQEETRQTYEISGNIQGLETDFDGKLATVLVYKKTNSDPTQEQLEYVEQVTLGENNSYSFVVNPKHEIDYYDTGDYIVTLSIEGCEKLVNVDVIKAPVPQQSVTFLDADGEVLKDSDGNDIIVSVDKGGSIDVYNIPIPSKEGHTFVKWDKSLININSDITVSPVYTKNTYNIVYVDHENETTQMIQVSYGDYFDLPEVEPITGKTFIGWDVDYCKYVADGNVDTEIYNVMEETPYYKATDGTYILSTQYDETVHNIIDTTEYFKYISEEKSVISESKIITAQWKNKTYTVNFCDLDGAVADTQFVEYGNAAIPPECVEKDGIVYSWDVSNAEWWNVTSDIYVYPYVPQKTQVPSPMINASVEDGGGMFYTDLTTGEEGTTIYYCVEGVITEESAQEYISKALLDKENENQMPGISIMPMPDSNMTGGGGVAEEDQDGIIKKFDESIQINPGTIVYAFAADAEGNISQISVFEFDNGIDDSDAIEMELDDEGGPLIYLPETNAKEGETIEVPLSIKNNPGITRLSVIIGYDAESFVDVNVVNGDVFDDFVCDIRDDGSIKITWESDTENTTDGTLAVLELTAGSEILEKAITVSVLDTEVPSFEENPFYTVNGRLEKDTTILGDVNGDGEVDFADGIRILKHDVGLIDLNGNSWITGDVNGDGEVDFADAILVLKFDVGLISSFKK